MNSHGIPSLKELYNGITIDVDRSLNRHLQMAGLSGRRLHLELVDAPEGLEDDDEEFEEEEDSENYDPLGLVPASEDEDEEDEEDEYAPCKDFPDGCLQCPDLECTHDGDAPLDDEENFERLKIMVLWPALGNIPRELSDEEIEQNPGLCRFLAQINTHNGI